MKTSFKIIPLLLGAVLFTSCADSSKSAVQTTTASITTADTAIITGPAETAPAALIEVPDGAQYSDFRSGMPDGFEASDGWSNGSMFNVTWRRSNVTFDNGRMQLIIDNDTKPKDKVPYSGGEFRSKDFYGYGRFEVSMKAIKNDGVVSSFFTYTGPSDNNPWDEIDVEILGKDTTQVQFNYFVDGKGGHEYMHELGFDASEDFHTYAFEWHKTSIAWFVDGEEVHRVEKDESKMPKTASKIMANAWCGKDVDGWLNAFNDSALPILAEYEWVMFTPFDE